MTEVSCVRHHCVMIQPVWTYQDYKAPLNRARRGILLAVARYEVEYVVEGIHDGVHSLVNGSRWLVAVHIFADKVNLGGCPDVVLLASRVVSHLSIDNILWLGGEVLLGLGVERMRDATGPKVSMLHCAFRSKAAQRTVALLQRGKTSLDEGSTIQHGSTLRGDLITLVRSSCR